MEQGNHIKKCWSIRVYWELGSNGVLIGGFNFFFFSFHFHYHMDYRTLCAWMMICFCKRFSMFIIANHINGGSSQYPHFESWHISQIRPDALTPLNSKNNKNDFNDFKRTIQFLHHVHIGNSIQSKVYVNHNRAVKNMPFSDELCAEIEFAFEASKLNLSWHLLSWHKYSRNVTWCLKLRVFDPNFCIEFPFFCVLMFIHHSFRMSVCIIHSKEVTAKPEPYTLSWQGLYIVNQ